MIREKEENWLFLSEPSAVILITIDTLTMKFKMYLTSDPEKRCREDFRAGELQMVERFKTREAMESYAKKIGDEMLSSGYTLIEHYSREITND